MLGKYLVGKRVAFMKIFELGSFKYGGTYADYCLTDIKSVIPLPDEMSFEQAACNFVNPLTAVAMIDRAKELKAKAIIITAAASQIGRMFIKLC